MQFLQTNLHSSVAQTIEQHPKTHGTSSSGGMEQAHTKHIKWHCCLHKTSGTLKVIASHKQPIRI